MAYLAIHIHNYLSHFLRSVVDAGRGRCGLQRIPKLVWGFKITARREEERAEALVNFQRLLHRRMGERRGLGFLTHYERKMRGSALIYFYSLTEKEL